MKNNIGQRWVGAFLSGMTLIAAIVYVDRAALAQTYPSKTIRIVTSAAGSGNDLTSRVLAQALSGGIGQSVIVDNRGILAVDAVLNAPADGHTVICYGSPL